jgi:hypothetical protein
MRLRRGAKIRREIQAQAEAALLVVKQHAEAGRKAQTETQTQSGNSPIQWAPPQIWSQSWPPPNVAEAAPQPPPPAPAPAEDRSADLLRVLDTVTRLCERVMDALDEDRAERRLMVDALMRLTDVLPPRTSVVEFPRPESNVDRLIGGSMPAGPEPEPVIDIRDNDRAVEVRCRFGDNWVDGFEICEVINAELGVQYRLRRRVDGVVLPELFDAADIRHVETFEELTSTPAQQRYWSPL